MPGMPARWTRSRLKPSSCVPLRSVHDPFGLWLTERIGADVTHHDHQFVRRLGPVGQRRDAVTGNMRTYQVLRSSMYFRNSATSSMARSREVLIDQIGVGDTPLTRRGQAQFVGLHDLVDPQDRAIGAARLDHGLHPGDSLLVHQVVAAVEAVDVSQDDDFHARFDLGVEVHHLGERVQCRLGDYLTDDP